MTPIFFIDQNDFRKWLEINHRKEIELLVGFYKKSSGKANMTWSQSVDAALCFGWIDGIRRSIDESSYCIRFTPRRPKSTWSNVNIKKAEELISQGLMQPEGLKSYLQRKGQNPEVATFRTQKRQLEKAMTHKFKSNRKAWNYFKKQAPSYQRMIVNWILSAKQEKTKVLRLEKAICTSEKQMRIY